jgi:hypothetical protein
MPGRKTILGRLNLPVLIGLVALGGSLLVGAVNWITAGSEGTSLLGESGESIPSKDAVANRRLDDSQIEALLPEEVDDCIDTGRCKDITVPFGEFGSVKVRARTLNVSFPPRPARLLDQYDMYVEMVHDGDASAAFVLSKVLSECRESYTTNEELERAVDALYQTRRIERPSENPGPPTYLGKGELKNQELAMRNRFFQCEGITEYQKDVESIEWLTVSADSGFVLAQLELASLHFETENFKLSQKYFEMTWQSSGSVLAAEGLHEIYKSGGGGIDPNPTKAAAYMYLSTYVFLEYVPAETSGPLLTRLRDRKRQALEAELLGLNPFEMKSAIEMAKEILTENENCCVL